jgi:cytoskeletal protein RodZ
MAEDFEVDGSPPEESENRTFVVAAAGLGGLIVLSLICLGLYVLVLAPRQRQAAIEAPTQIALQNTLTAEALTATTAAGLFTATPEPSQTTEPTDTAEPTITRTATPTQVVVLPTDTPSPTPFTTLPTLGPLTVTAAVALTQTQQAIAGGAATVTPTATATALPVTGFADEAGLPGLLLMAGALLTIIFFSRRLRTTPTPGRS